MEKRLIVREKATGVLFEVMESDAYYIVPRAWGGAVLGEVDLAYKKSEFERITLKGG